MLFVSVGFVWRSCLVFSWFDLLENGVLSHVRFFETVSYRPSVGFVWRLCAFSQCWICLEIVCYISVLGLFRDCVLYLSVGFV